MAARPTTQVAFTGIAVLALLLGGCRDSGLPGRNTPVDQAVRRPSSYPLYEAADPLTDRGAAAFVLEGSRWQTMGLPERVPERLLKAVGGAGGMQVYALTWDEAPYSSLYVAEPNGQLRRLGRTR